MRKISQNKSEKTQTMRPIMGVQIVELIKVRVSSGAGTPEDPSRLVAQYWDKKGKLKFIEDPYIGDFDGESNA